MGGVTLRQGQTGHLGLTCNMPGLGRSLLWPLRAQCWPWLCHEHNAKVRAQILSHCFGTVCTDHSPFCIFLALVVCARKRGKEEHTWQHGCNRGRKLRFYLWWLWYQPRMTGHELQTYFSPVPTSTTLQTALPQLLKLHLQETCSKSPSQKSFN